MTVSRSPQACEYHDMGSENCILKIGFVDTKVITKKYIVMRRYQVAAFIALFFLAGCRTYGGHDSEALTAEVLQQVVGQIADAARTAEGEMALLQAAAQDDPALASLADNFGMLVEKNASLVEKMSTMEEKTDYRSLNRGMGAAITELYKIESGYQSIKEEAARLRGVNLATSNVAEGLSYEAVPPYYRRIKLASDVSMRTALGIN